MLKLINYECGFFQNFFKEVKETFSADREGLENFAKMVIELETKFTDSFERGKAAFEDIRASK